MIKIIIETFWILLPAGLANMAPVLFKWIPIFNSPIDLNKTFRNKPILGKNKTFRGIITGIITAIFITYIQYLLYPYTKQFTIINYQEINIYLLGFLLGFGALLGDSIKSFFKRQLSIAPSISWAPFDQIDWIIGSILLSGIYIKISPIHAITAIIIFGLLHPIINIIGYYSKIKKTKF